MDPEKQRSAALLKRVADALDLPVEGLFTVAASGSADEMAECLRLWQRLASEVQRRRALDALRSIADESEPPI